MLMICETRVGWFWFFFFSQELDTLEAVKLLNTIDLANLAQDSHASVYEQYSIAC